MDTQSSLGNPIIESNLLESSLLSEDGLNIISSEESETLELDIQTINSTTEFDWFTDSETETSLVYSTPLAMDGNDNEFPENNVETEIVPEETNPDVPSEEPAIPLTRTVVVGESGSTQFTFNFAEDTPQEVIDGVREAAGNWLSVLNDPVNINIDFTFTPDETGNLGVAIPNFIPLPYLDGTVSLDVNSALTDDVSSINDNTAVANLPADNNINLLINNTAENNGSDTPYLDDNGGLNNSTILVTRANAKALGLDFADFAELNGITPEEVAEIISAVYDFPLDANGVDAMINLSSNISWDFNPSDGIASDQFDFVGVATHEIGHALGFVSTTEFLDGLAVSEIEGLEGLEGISLDQFITENSYAPSVLDLFRFSPESFEQGARDFTTGNVGNKYFSIDGGETEIAPMSGGANTATNIGDRQQLSHWEDNLNIGIMDPTGAPGESLEITENDLIAFDVIGWDV